MGWNVHSTLWNIKAIQWNKGNHLFHRMNVWRFEGFPCVSYLPVLPKKWAFLCNYVNEVNIFHWKFCINESLLFICKSFQWK
ncbi:hypothetical protein B5F71_08295 [Bacteroides sp. An269]|nr:hypothetical protein B5G04_06665 [Bacteroides sp. An51A]OUO78243.1 hypothetical protein B5F71_08295 [Bacteroides sp. An269]